MVLRIVLVASVYKASTFPFASEEHYSKSVARKPSVDTSDYLIIYRTLYITNHFRYPSCMSNMLKADMRSSQT